MVRIKKILSLFLALLFMSYYAGTTLFSHAHIICGATIFHSHFHTDSHHDTKGDCHTEHCITLIAQISHFDYIDFSYNIVSNPLQFPIHEKRIVKNTQWEGSIYSQNISLRAPPIV